MKEGKTKSGFAYRFDEKAANDMLFFETLSEIEGEGTRPLRKIAAIGKAAEMLLGKEQKAALYAHISAQNEGRVPPGVLEAELGEIMGGSPETKNC